MIPKPAKGTAKRDRARRLALSRAIEGAEKSEVRARDIFCRVPWCCSGRLLEVAHLSHKGAGGNPLNDRSVRARMILLCADDHRGTFGLDSGRLDATPISPDRGTDGPVQFTLRNRRGVDIRSAIG